MRPTSDILSVSPITGPNKGDLIRLSKNIFPIRCSNVKCFHTEKITEGLTMEVSSDTSNTAFKLHPKEVNYSPGTPGKQ